MNDEEMQFRRIEKMLLAVASDRDPSCPTDEQLARYLQGILVGTEQLVVVTHLRQCPMCHYTVEAVRPPEPRRRMQVAQLIPMPVMAGLHRSVQGTHTRQYMAAGLIIKITIAPPSNDRWRITGRVLQDNQGQQQGLCDCLVVLQKHRHRYTQRSDADGFFDFEAIPAGTYALSAMNESVHVQIQDVVLAL